jgi:pimeloyl-ACP methyl ester carboxylesterase
VVNTLPIKQFARHWRRLLGPLAIALCALSLWQLESGRAGIQTEHAMAGPTPVTLYRNKAQREAGPLVIVAHGFAGSRQLMQAFSLHLARAGYTALAFDYEGHGRHRTPMSGDVTAIDGTTAKLVAQTLQVIDYGATLPGHDGRIALLGHSMASDIIVRAALQHSQIDTVVAISMFSEAVTADEPRRLLVISGEWESRLREVALKALQQVEPAATEGQTARSDTVARRAVVAPRVEHVGVLFSATSLRESLDWLNQSFERSTEVLPRASGSWILLLLAGIVLSFRPLLNRLPASEGERHSYSTRRILLAIGLPALLTPLLATTVYQPFLPVLVADYLMLHLAVYGLLQLALLNAWPRSLAHLSLPVLGLQLLWGIALFGLALDRYAASFWPTPERLQIIALLALGTLPFMLADSHVSGAGSGRLWQRLLARFAILLSLGLAAALDMQRLGFVLLVFPVLLLFFMVHGLLGRWSAQHNGPLNAGLGLGLVLAWALGVSFPLFDAAG